MATLGQHRRGRGGWGGWPAGVIRNDRWAFEPPPLAEADFAGSGPPVFTRSDRMLRDDIADRLSRLVPGWEDSVHLSVHRGNVILNGTVPEEARIDEIVTRVAALPGVRGVVNHLRTVFVEEH